MIRSCSCNSSGFDKASELASGTFSNRTFFSNNLQILALVPNDRSTLLYTCLLLGGILIHSLHLIQNLGQLKQILFHFLGLYVAATNTSTYARKKPHTSPTLIIPLPGHLRLGIIPLIAPQPLHPASSGRGKASSPFSVPQSTERWSH